MVAIHVGVLLGDPRLPYSYAPGGTFGPEEIGATEALAEALETLEGFRFTYFDDHENLIDALRESRPELVLNLCDVGYRNRWEQERNLPALLEILDIPYTGADPVGIVLSNDKALVAAAAEHRGVSVPLQEVVVVNVGEPRLPTRYPSLIKPNVSAGSLGITEKSLVHDAKEAREYLAWLRDEIGASEALVQEYLPGTEYTLGLIGNPGQGFVVLPPLEIDFGKLDPGLPQILTHGSKADPTSPYWDKLSFHQARLADDILKELVDGAEMLFERLGLRDYARFDFRNGADGRPRLLDANVNPTWYANGKMAMMAGWAGHDYATMLRMILQTAMKRVGLEAG